MPGIIGKIAGRLRAIAGDLAFPLGAPRMRRGYRNLPDGDFMPRTRYSSATVFYRRERIRLADNIYIGHFTYFDGTGGIEIGEGAQIGVLSCIYTHSSHVSIRLYGDEYMNVHEDDRKAYQRKPVKIGRYVFIGARVCILPGVTIGDGALVSAGSVVKRDVEAFAVVAGNPAVKIGDTREMDKKSWSDEFAKHYYQARLGIPPEKWWDFESSESD